MIGKKNVMTENRDNVSHIKYVEYKRVYVLNFSVMIPQNHHSLITWIIGITGSFHALNIGGRHLLNYHIITICSPSE